MQRRNTEARRAAIVEWVNRDGHVQVESLAAEFGTSEVTIRKDLTTLAAQKLLVRQFGGAAPIQTSADSLSHNRADARAALGQVEDKSASARKQAIGVAAARLVSNNSRIIIDSGSTTACMLPHLDIHSRLVVMTNSLHVASTLTGFDSEPTVLMTGGTWDAQSQSFQGHMAEQMTQAYSFDLAFIGASGLDVSRGTTTFNELTGLTQTMASTAKDVVIMAESGKFLHKMPNLELPWHSIAYLVTDNDIDEKTKQTIEKQGVTVITVAPDGE